MIRGNEINGKPFTDLSWAWRLVLNLTDKMKPTPV